MAWITATSRYELIGKMGDEEDGIVYKAMESGTERIFAVKVFHREKSPDEERRHRVAIRRQTQILAEVRNRVSTLIQVVD